MVNFADLNIYYENYFIHFYHLKIEKKKRFTVDDSTHEKLHFWHFRHSVLERVQIYFMDEK